MPLFRRKGEAPPLPEAISFKEKAASLRNANEALGRRHTEIQREIDGLAFELIEAPTPALEAKVSELERERDQIASTKRRNTFAATEYDRRGDEASAADALRRKRGAFKELRRLSGTQIKEAEHVVAGLKEAFRAWARMEATRKRMMAAWPDDVLPESLLYDKTALAILRHTILLIGRENGLPNAPGGLYARMEFNAGLVALVKAMHANVQDKLSDEAASVSSYLPPLEAEQSLEAPIGPTTEPHAITDAEIEANDKAGNPANWPLSGAAWQEISDTSKPQISIAPDTDIDPFTGAPININDI